MKKVVAFGVLFVASMVVYFAGGYWAGPSYGARTAVKSVVPILLMVSTVYCARRPALRRWRGASLALLAASAGFLVAWWWSGPLARVLGAAAGTAQGLALQKLSDAACIVAGIGLVASVGGLGRRDLFLKKGRWKAGLAVGFGAFAVCAAILAFEAAREGLSPGRLLALSPWILLFVFANGFAEELHFRGLLLGPFETLLGRHGANLCIALFFTLSHAPVTYAGDTLPFMAVLFVLALAWGYLIQKTESLWGAVVFHAGADLLVILGILRTYGALHG